LFGVQTLYAGKNWLELQLVPLAHTPGVLPHTTTRPWPSVHSLAFRH
jgi:hypothetical protein